MHSTPKQKLVNDTDFISIILPCRNEEHALETCLNEIKSVIYATGINMQVIVVDNGSTDRSKEIVEKKMKSFPQLELVTEPLEGYGQAYIKGFEYAKGDYIFMADADGTYDFADIPRFLREAKKGNALVVGNRFSKNIPTGTMPFLHKHFGNPLLSFITRLFFGVKIRDVHCGQRMITRDALSKIVLYTAGMEFASEMIVKVARQKLPITELSITYRQRIGSSKLNTFSDGWRHLRFLLLYSPFFLFILPGATLFLVGTISLLSLYFFNIQVFGLQLYFHPMFLSSLLVLLGYQLIFFGGFSKVYAVTHLGDTDQTVLQIFKYVTIERAGILGLIIATIGVAIYAYIFIFWISSGFGSLNETKNSIIALTLITLGVQTIFSAFMLSTLGIKER